MFKDLRGETPEPIQSMALNLERNRAKIFPGFRLSQPERHR